MSKKRVLFVNEFSELNTGFSAYTKYLLPRLYATGKYEIAELATYCNPLHPLVYEKPWKIYPNEPDPRDKEACNVFRSVKENQFGRWRFEEVLLDFKPTHVIIIRDPWMDSFVCKSPYRSYFKLMMMPTCDGQPQKPEWLDMYASADMVLTYTHWAKNVLETESGGKIKVFDVATCASDTDVFVPNKRNENRELLGIDPNIYIVQSVMRNQPRKLIPDLMKAFNRYLDICEEQGRSDIAQKSFLYLHTSHPDMGWDIPSEIQKHKLSHKILFTYICRKCNAVYPSFYQGDVCNCKNCGSVDAHFPNTSHGVSKELLAKIQSIADLYVQYSTSEGQGIPINDAKSCGVPCMVVDYSAMSEQAYNGGSIPINVIRFFQESVNQTNQLRAYPDNEDAAQKMFEFFTLPQEDRDILGDAARRCVETYYNWELIAKVWENAIDNLEGEDKWSSPPQIIKPNLNIPPNINNEQFVIWIYEQILFKPEEAYGSNAQKLISILNAGHELHIDPDGRMQEIPVTRQSLLNNILSHINQVNSMEQLRYNRVVKGVGNNDKQQGYLVV